MTFSTVKLDKKFLSLKDEDSKKKNDEFYFNSFNFIYDFDKDTANYFCQRLKYASLENKEDINVYIDSRGGEVVGFLKMYDMINMVKHNNDISTIGFGECASCGALLLSSGTKGKRLITENSRVLLHQVSAGACGTNAEIQSSANEINRINELVCSILAKNCDKTVDEIKEVISKSDYWMTAEQAVEFGICDRIVRPEEYIAKIEDDKSSSSFLEDMETKSQKIEQAKLSFEIKSLKEEDDSCYYITGIASTPSVDIMGDIIMPQALMDSISRIGPPKFMHQHELESIPLGSCEKIWQQEDKGVLNTYVKLKMPKAVQFCKDIFELLKINAYGGLSLGYKTNEFSFDKDRNKVIKSLNWYEISLVTVTANPECEIIEFKNLNLDIKDVKDIRSSEKFLISKGISKKEACTLISIIKSENKCDTIQSGLQEGEPPYNDDVNNALSNALGELNVIVDRIRKA